MDDIDKNNRSPSIVLSDDELELLSTEHTVLNEVDVNSPRMQSLRSHVMAQIEKQVVEKQASPDITALLTVKSDAGDWLQLSDKIRKKTLHIDNDRGVESYLLRIDAGAEDDSHWHTSDEHCLVLEGDISFGNIHLTSGDYHLAPKGSMHENAYSKTGALLFIQTGIGQQVSL